MCPKLQTLKLASIQREKASYSQQVKNQTKHEHHWTHTHFTCATKKNTVHDSNTRKKTFLVKITRKVDTE